MVGALEEHVRQRSVLVRKVTPWLREIGLDLKDIRLMLSRGPVQLALSAAQSTDTLRRLLDRIGQLGQRSRRLRCRRRRRRVNRRVNVSSHDPDPTDTPQNSNRQNPHHRQAHWNEGRGHLAQPLEPFDDTEEKSGVDENAEEGDQAHDQMLLLPGRFAHRTLP